MLDTQDERLEVAARKLEEALTALQTPGPASSPIKGAALFKAIDLFHHVYLVRLAIATRVSKELREWNGNKEAWLDQVWAHGKGGAGWEGDKILASLRRMYRSESGRNRMTEKYLYLSLQLRLCYITDLYSESSISELPRRSSLESSVTTMSIRPPTRSHIRRLTCALLPLESENHQPSSSGHPDLIPFHARNLSDSILSNIALIRTQFDDLTSSFDPTSRTAPAVIEQVKAQLITVKDIPDVAAKIRKWTGETTMELQALGACFAEMQDLRGRWSGEGSATDGTVTESGTEEEDVSTDDHTEAENQHRLGSARQASRSIRGSESRPEGHASHPSSGGHLGNLEESRSGMSVDGHYKGSNEPTRTIWATEKRERILGEEDGSHERREKHSPPAGRNVIAMAAVGIAVAKSVEKRPRESTGTRAGASMSRFRQRSSSTGEDQPRLLSTVNRDGSATRTGGQNRGPSTAIKISRPETVYCRLYDVFYSEEHINERNESVAGLEAEVHNHWLNVFRSFCKGTGWEEPIVGNNMNLLQATRSVFKQVYPDRSSVLTSGEVNMPPLCPDIFIEQKVGPGSSGTTSCAIPALVAQVRLGSISDVKLNSEAYTEAIWQTYAAHEIFGCRYGMYISQANLFRMEMVDGSRMHIDCGSETTGEYTWDELYEVLGTLNLGLRVKIVDIRGEDPMPMHVEGLLESVRQHCRSLKAMPLRAVRAEMHRSVERALLPAQPSGDLADLGSALTSTPEQARAGHGSHRGHGNISTMNGDLQRQTHPMDQRRTSYMAVAANMNGRSRTPRTSHTSRSSRAESEDDALAQTTFANGFILTAEMQGCLRGITFVLCPLRAPTREAKHVAQPVADRETRHMREDIATHDDHARDRKQKKRRYTEMASEGGEKATERSLSKNMRRHTSGPNDAHRQNQPSAKVDKGKQPEQASRHRRVSEKYRDLLSDDAGEHEDMMNGRGYHDAREGMPDLAYRSPSRSMTPVRPHNHGTASRQALEEPAAAPLSREAAIKSGPTRFITARSSNRVALTSQSPGSHGLTDSSPRRVRYSSYNGKGEVTPAVSTVRLAPEAALGFSPVMAVPRMDEKRLVSDSEAEADEEI